MFFLNKLIALYKDWKGVKSLKEKLGDVYCDIVDELQEIERKLKNLEETNYELGIYHLKNNNISDALLRFNLLQLFKCRRPGLFYYIAHCYMDQFKYEKADKYIGLYYQSGDKEFIDEVEYFRLLIDKQEISKIPLSLIADKFDQLSEEFNIKKNKNAPQILITEALIKTINSSAKTVANNVLDIGCGTGIVGQILREERLTNAIVGIDISKKMIEQAGRRFFDKKKVYSKLINEDAINWLSNNQSRENYDVIVLSDFITFHSNIAHLLQLLNTVSYSQTILALNFKKSKNADVEFVHKLGEFRYNPEVVKSYFHNNAWKILSEENIVFNGQNNSIIMIFVKL